MSVAGRAAATYRRMEVETRSQLELVALLYDGALRFVGQSRAAIERGDIAARGEAVSRALAIIGELQSTLNLDKGGDIAAELDRLYVYITERLLEITTTGNAAICDELQKLLAPLSEAWKQAAANERTKGLP